MTKKLLQHPLLQAYFWILLGATICYSYINITERTLYDIEVTDQKIKQEMIKVAKSCGEGYYLFWFLMDSREFRLKDSFVVKDIVESNYCDKSFGKCHPNYQESYILDYKSKIFLDKLKDNKVYNPAISTLASYSSFRKILGKAKNPIQDLSLTIVRDKKRNLIYLFSLSRTTENISCNQDYIESGLLNISNIAKGNI